MAHIYISIGSNIHPRQHIQTCLHDLTQHFGYIKSSSIYESAAVGFDGDPFHNLVISAQSDLSPAILAHYLRELETAHGRQRIVGQKFNARTLDLDLLLYDDLQSTMPQLPHPDIIKYAFVLAPLVELYPHGLHPVLHCSYQSLWDKFNKEQQPLTKISYT